MKVALVLMMLLSGQAHGGISLGGYVPFGLSTQKDADGGRNTYSFVPVLSTSFAFHMPRLRHSLIPEVGLALHGSDDHDDYSKTTLFGLLDLRYPINKFLAARYGLGLFLTRIKGKGGGVLRENGNERTWFRRPSGTVSSRNGTLNLGVEVWLGRGLSGRLSSFWFAPFDNKSRDVSYMALLSWDFWRWL